jgi:hypothetical protein
MGNSNDQYTRDVRERGLQAVQERRQASQYGINNRDAALQYMLDSGYTSQTPTDGYRQFQQQRGFRPQNYNIVLGQGDGPYAGFRTEGQLKAALLGRSEGLRGYDQQQAGELARLADQYLGEVEGQYTTQLDDGREAIGKWTKHDPTAPMDPDRLSGPGGALGGAQKLQYEHADQEHTGGLNDWLAKTTDPYLEALSTAEQIGQTPLRDYATIAGAEYGVDPNIVGGWYPEASQIQDFRNQRDLSALDQYGMTQSEYQGVLGDMEQRQNQQNQQGTQDQQDQQDLQVSDNIFQLTGMDGNQLAQGADLTTEQLYSVVTSDTYQSLNQEIAQIVADPGASEEDIQASVDEVLAGIRSDPTLYRVLSAQWLG